MNLRTISKLMLGLALVAFTATGCKKDECKDKNCGNGSCVDGSCVCNTGYEGSECGTEKRAKFLGSWTATETCTSGNFNWTMTSTASSQGVTAFIFNNFTCLRIRDPTSLKPPPVVRVTPDPFLHHSGHLFGKPTDFSGRITSVVAINRRRQ